MFTVLSFAGAMVIILGDDIVDLFQEHLSHILELFLSFFCSQEGSVNRSLFSFLYMCDYMPDEGDNVYC